MATIDSTMKDRFDKLKLEHDSEIRKISTRIDVLQKQAFAMEWEISRRVVNIPDVDSNHYYHDDVSMIMIPVGKTEEEFEMRKNQMKELVSRHANERDAEFQRQRDELVKLETKVLGRFKSEMAEKVRAQVVALERLLAEHNKQMLTLLETGSVVGVSGGGGGTLVKPLKKTTDKVNVTQLMKLFKTRISRLQEKRAQLVEGSEEEDDIKRTIALMMDGLKEYKAEYLSTSDHAKRQQTFNRAEAFVTEIESDYSGFLDK